MKKYLFLAAISLVPALAFVAVPASQDPKEPEPFITIGAWNIQWLGNKEKRPEGLRVDQDPADLADYIFESKVDLLSVEEISDNDGVADTYTNKTLVAVCKKLGEKTNTEWSHVLMPKPTTPEEDVMQLCGLLWNTGKVTKIGKTFEVPVPRAGPNDKVWKRHPHATKFSFGKGKTDVVMIPLHMKSNKDGAKAGMMNREIEAALLAEKMAEVKKHFQDEDIIMLGDTNITVKTEPAIDIFKKLGFKDLNDADNSTYITNAPFDRFFIPKNQPEFKDSVQEVYRQDYLTLRNLQAKDFVPRFSDHFMIKMKVRIMDDDD